MVSRGVLGSAVSRQGENKSYFSSGSQTGDPVDGINSARGCGFPLLCEAGWKPPGSILGEVEAEGETGASPRARLSGRTGARWLLQGFLVPIETCSHHQVLVVDGERWVALARSRRGLPGLLLWETSVCSSLLRGSWLFKIF